MMEVSPGCSFRGFARSRRMRGAGTVESDTSIKTESDTAAPCASATTHTTLPVPFDAGACHKALSPDGERTPVRELQAAVNESPSGSTGVT